MPQPRFEVAIGTIDGTNVIYYVSSAYRPGTTAVYLNGQLKNKLFTDGWLETNSFAGEILLNEAPLIGDIVQVFFIDTSPALVEEEVTPLYGTITEHGSLAGRLSELDLLVGAIVPESPMLAILLDLDGATGIILEEQALSGILREIP